MVSVSRSPFHARLSCTASLPMSSALDTQQEIVALTLKNRNFRIWIYIHIYVNGCTAPVTYGWRHFAGLALPSCASVPPLAIIGGAITMPAPFLYSWSTG